MKIGILINSIYVGGMERQMAYWFEGLLNKGYEVFLYTISVNNGLSKRKKLDLPRQKVYPLYYNKYSRFFSEKLLAFYLKKHRPDYLFSFQVGAIELASKVKNQTQLDFKIIGTLRGIKYAFNSKSIERYRIAVSSCQVVLCNSKEGVRLYEKHLNYKHKTPCVYVPNIIKVRHNNNIIKPEKWTILFAGSLKQVKDPLMFIKGIDLLINKNKSIRVYIAGDGELRKVLEDYVVKNKLQDNVHFLGFVKPEQVPYNQSHIVVSTSIRESSSNTILEGLANGCLVVGTDTGGTTELLYNKSYGKLIKVGDYQELSDALAVLIEMNQEQYVIAVKNAQNYIALYHNEDDIINKLESIFETTVNI